MKTPLLLIGGGGHCRSCIDVIEATALFDIVGILDKRHRVGERVLGLPIVGVDEEIAQFKSQASQFLVTVGCIGNPIQRVHLYNSAIAAGLTPAIVISPRAHLSQHAEVASGTIILHDAIVNAGAKIGHNCIINSRALIEHDVSVGDHSHISTSTTVNGATTIGERCFVGSGSILFQGLNIVSYVTVGAGSLVTESIASSGIYYGRPAQLIRAS